MTRRALKTASALILLFLCGVGHAEQGQGNSSRRDPETARLFNGKVRIAVAGDLARTSRALIGRAVSKETLAELVGAPDGAFVDISAISHDMGDAITHSISIATYHAYYVRQHRNIYNEAGSATLHNASFTVKSDAPSGVATRVLAHEVVAARELGFKKITVNAVGAPDSNSNGYYTWPRLGFNAPVPTYIGRPENLRSATDLNSLMALPDGPEWWKANGTNGLMEFDLSPSSTSTQVHEAYLKAKGISIHE